MKKIRFFAAALSCVISFGLFSCSDDDDALKSTLKEPVPATVAGSVSSLTFEWDKVDQATQYGYELTDQNGEVVKTDVTKTTAVKFTGLRPATTYTLSVWAYSKVYGDVGSSKIATLTATTASTEALAAPQLTATVAAGTATVNWEAVTNATTYAYSYSVPDKATGERNVVSGETSDTYIEISGLPLNEEYTVTVTAKSSNEVYTESEPASVSFTMTHTEAWTVTGTYTSAHLGTTFPVTMTAYDDNTYMLESWYGVNGYNFEFSVSGDGTVTPTGDYKTNSNGDYVIPTGVAEMPDVYLSMSNVSTFSGNERSGQISIRTCNYGNGTDTFTWIPARQEIWRVTGTYHSHILNADYTETLIAYDDQSYTLEPFYGVGGYNLEFKIGTDGMEIINYYGIYDYGCWIETGIDDDEYWGIYIWPWENFSYMTGNSKSGAINFYTIASVGDWGYDTFTWTSSDDSLSIDDLTGAYTFYTSGQEQLENWPEWSRFDYADAYTVTKSATNPNALVFDNFYWYDYPVEGVVDLNAMTVTFQPQDMGYYVFAAESGQGDPVVGTIDPSGKTITISGWSVWWSGTSYIQNAVTVFEKN
ncbi:MAG: fibronectin type III domain-containing protein [Staphylococcus sp.]|nr:fibronectin type III domain-containing protein [Staphylococcus sp.]